MLAAVKLYELGRLSLGRAAELAGVPRVEFLLSLERYKVFPLEAELRDLERGNVIDLPLSQKGTSDWLSTTFSTNPAIRA